MKSHLYQTKTTLTWVTTSHAYTAKNLPLVLRRAYESRHGQAVDEWRFQEIRVLAREIELLAPAVDGGGSRPDNCEYPWQDPMGEIHIPAEHSFGQLKLNNTPGGILLLKLLPAAINDALRAVS